MKPFRKNVAVAIDGGGIKGVIVARALAILEDYLGKSSYEIFRLAAGTNTVEQTDKGKGGFLTADAVKWVKSDQD